METSTKKQKQKQKTHDKKVQNHKLSFKRKIISSKAQKEKNTNYQYKD